MMPSFQCLVCCCVNSLQGKAEVLRVAVLNTCALPHAYYKN